MRQNELDQNDYARQRKEELDQALHRLQTEVEQLEKDLNQKLKASKQNLEQLEKMMKELKIKRQEKIDNDLEREQIQAQLRQLNKEKVQIQKDIEETSKQVQECQSTKNILEKQIKDLHQLLVQLNIDDQETKNALQSNKAQLLQIEGDLVQETTKLQEINEQIRDLQAEIDLLQKNRKLKKKNAQRLSALRKQLKEKKEQRGNVRALINKYRHLVSGLNLFIVGLSADSRRLALQIAMTQQNQSQKQENNVVNDTRLITKKQKKEKLTDMKDNTQSKIEEDNNHHAELIKKDKQMIMDIGNQQEDIMKKDQFQQQLKDEANEMKVEIKYKKKQMNEKKK